KTGLEQRGMKEAHSVPSGGDAAPYERISQQRCDIGGGPVARVRSNLPCDVSQIRVVLHPLQNRGDMTGKALVDIVGEPALFEPFESVDQCVDDRAVVVRADPLDGPNIDDAVERLELRLGQLLD